MKVNPRFNEHVITLSGVIICVVAAVILAGIFALVMNYRAKYYSSVTVTPIPDIILERDYPDAKILDRMEIIIVE